MQGGADLGTDQGSSAAGRSALAQGRFGHRALGRSSPPWPRLLRQLLQRLALLADRGTAGRVGVRGGAAGDWGWARLGLEGGALARPPVAWRAGGPPHRGGGTALAPAWRGAVSPRGDRGGAALRGSGFPLQLGRPLSSRARRSRRLLRDLGLGLAVAGALGPVGLLAWRLAHVRSPSKPSTAPAVRQSAFLPDRSSHKTGRRRDGFAGEPRRFGGNIATHRPRGRAAAARRPAVRDLGRVTAFNPQPVDPSSAGGRPGARRRHGRSWPEPRFRDVPPLPTERAPRRPSWSRGRPSTRSCRAAPQPHAVDGGQPAARWRSDPAQTEFSTEAAAS